MSPAERELVLWRLKRLGEEWDTRLRGEWLSGTPSVQIARLYGLELATVEALIPRTLPKRKAQ
jgi:hypothetical protein